MPRAPWACAVRWRSSHCDEDGGAYTIDHETYEEALDEAEGDSVEVCVVTTHAVTPLLARLQRGTNGDTSGAFDLLVAEWAARQGRLDGVWWEDAWDPVSLSAPRGTISEHRVAGWTFRRSAGG